MTRTAPSRRSSRRLDRRPRTTLGTSKVAVAALGAAVLGFTGLVVASSASATSPTVAGHHYGRSLFATDGIAGDDVWTVGLTPGDRAGIWHWDGASWTSARHPASTHSSVLFGVDARTSSDTWAVGAQDPDGTGIRVAYAQHWDGSRWRVVAADPDLFTSEANAVAARSVHDAWIVGDAQNSAAGSVLPFAEHWDGTGWLTVPTAKIDPDCDSTLEDVTATAADDVWAAGSVTCDGLSTSLVEHWNGKRWSRVDVPSPRRATYTGLTGITVVAPDDVWAVGFSSRGQDPGRNMILHWDGKGWTIVPAPNPGAASYNHGLSDVSGSGTDDVWAAGSRSGIDGVTAEMLHWDGTRWLPSSIPSSGFDDPPGDGLYGVVALTKQSAFTVGIAKTRGASVEAGFIEHWNGSGWSLN